MLSRVPEFGLHIFGSQSRQRTAVGVVIAIELLAVRPLWAEPAHFWISPSNVAPPGPEAASIPGINGTTRYLHIWAQPATVDPGAYNANSNPFKTLTLFSLDLVTDQPVVDLLDTGIVVYNPMLSSTENRFEFVNDSATGLTSDRSLATVQAGTPDRVRRLQGFTISNSSTHLGIGPTCHPNDSYCGTTSSGAPAWLLASVPYQPILDSGSAGYFLQVSANGINHAGEDTIDTSVIFGLGTAPIYNASTNRETTLSGDTADLMVQAASASSVQDLHWLGGTGQWTDTNWDATGVTPSAINNALLDASPNPFVVTVTGKQEANQTTVNGGRLHLDADGSLASAVTVSSSGAVSGNGWIASDLTLGGTLALTSNQPLSVVGIADVAGGNIGLASDYSQLPNTVSEPFQLLTAHGGIQGMLSTAAGAPLGNNLFLESIVHNPNDITIQVRSEGGILGDFSGNGSVENADLTLLLNNWAGPASPVPAGWIGTPQPTAPAIDNDELTALLNNWGNSSGGGSYTSGAVPEPSSIVLCLSAAIGLLVSIGRGSVTSRQTVHR